MLQFLLRVFGFLGGFVAIIFAIFYYVDRRDYNTISYKEFKGIYGISPDSWSIEYYEGDFAKIKYINSRNGNRYLMTGKTIRDYILIRRTINKRKKLLEKQRLNQVKGDMLKDLKKDIEMYKKNCWENLRDYGTFLVVDDNGIPKLVPKIQTKKEHH